MYRSKLKKLQLDLKTYTLVTDLFLIKNDFARLVSLRDFKEEEEKYGYVEKRKRNMDKKNKKDEDVKGDVKKVEEQEEEED